MQQRLKEREKEAGTPDQDPEEDDEASVLAHLGKIAHYVSKKTAQSQAQRKAEAKKLTGGISQRLTPKQIDKIVAAVNEGRITLPDLDLENMDQEDYATIRALADSG